MLLHYIVIKNINDICYIYVGYVLFILRGLLLFSLLVCMLDCLDKQGVSAQNKTIKPIQTVC